MPKSRNYKVLISEYIKKQMIILGPVVAVEKARKLEKIKVKDDGTVIQLSGDGEEMMVMIECEFEGMMGSIAHTVLLRVIDSHERGSSASESGPFKIAHGDSEFNRVGRLLTDNEKSGAIRKAENV